MIKNREVIKKPKSELAVMKQHQVVQLIFQHNPRGRTVADVARHFGLAESTVYRWQQDPAAGGTHIPSKYFIGFCEYTGDGRIIEWLAINCGYRLEPIEDQCQEDLNPIDCMLEISRQQGRLSETLAKYVGREIPPAVKPKISYILSLIAQEVRQFNARMLREDGENQYIGEKLGIK